MVSWIGGTKLSKDSWALMKEKGIPTPDQLNNMAFILDLLRPGDIFVDAGANTGAYSILASGVRGAYSYAAEPDHSAFEHLQTNIQLNHLENLITPIPIAPTAGQMTPIQHGQSQTTFDPPPLALHTLDQYIRRRPDVLKIDAQVLEMALQHGGTPVLLAASLKVILIEQTEQAKAEVPQSLQQQLLDLQFETYSYEPELRKLHPIHPAETHSSIVYCRDPEWVNLRVSIADKVKAFPPSF